MNKHWTFYDEATGIFDNGSICIPDHADPAENAPAGHVALEGVFNSRTQRVDLSTLDVIAYTPPPPPLAAVQEAQLVMLANAYDAAIAQAVSFTTAAGVTQTYQSDPDSVQKLSNCLVGWASVQSVPPGFYWVAADNTHVPFTWVDLQGLAVAFTNAGHAAFDHLQALKSQVRAATTAEAIATVVW